MRSPASGPPSPLRVSCRWISSGNWVCREEVGKRQLSPRCPPCPRGEHKFSFVYVYGLVCLAAWLRDDIGGIDVCLFLFVFVGRVFLVVLVQGVFFFWVKIGTGTITLLEQ